MSDWKGPVFRRTLVGMVRRHVPERDVEDIVQATLTEALSPSAPKDDASLQRWLLGVARHKVADRHRRGRRESFELPEVAVDAPAHAEADLVRWAVESLPADGEDPRRTLGWMMREGDGEKLEAIAESERIPAPRVRKRVSRLRSHLRAQWKKELALLAALGVIAVAIWLAHRAHKDDVAHDVRPVPSEVVPRLEAPAPPRAPPLVPAAPTPSIAPPVPSSSARPAPTSSAPPRPRSTSLSSDAESTSAPPRLSGRASKVK
jgi:DNA-directed RNA polymerase specialized sigma24 family protein